MMFLEGQSTGHIGLECINSTSYDGTANVCANGEIIESEMQFTCPDSVPYCVQCGERGWGAALCLSTPDIGNRDCGNEAKAILGNDGDDDEEFLPPSTPAPAAVVPIGNFDQCETEQDVGIWTANGGESTRPEHSNFCSREYNGGCFLDSDCIETCFQETYGYSKECSTCFGMIPACSIENDCVTKCMADSLGSGCQECNAPCIDELNKCTGLPIVTSTAPPTANLAPLPTQKPSSSSPTSKPSTSPMVQPTPSTPVPSSRPTDNPVTPEPSSKPTDNPATSESTTQPTDNPVTSETTTQPTDNETTTQPNGSSTTSPTAKPTDPRPSSASPTDPPTAGPVTPPTPDNNRDSAASMALSSSSMSVVVGMGLLAAVIA